MNDWFEHFKDVFANDDLGEEHDNQRFENGICDELDHTLNRVITEEEVRNAVKKI